MWPGAIAVGQVAAVETAPDQPRTIDLLQGFVRIHADPALSSDVLARLLRQRVVGPTEGESVAVHASDEARQPPRSGLSEQHPQSRVALEHTAKDEGQHRPLRLYWVDEHVSPG